ncbi:MAG: GatB/YqeY domain-containing protein [Candidatus Omnitrophota bacterium]|nr:MAG: GatB/YqeY domain-containing protein [Candidatus Omnitrophota bacterium]
MLEDKIYKEYIAALKSRDKHKADFLSFIRAELKNAAINVKKEKLEDNEVLEVLKKQKKRLQETKDSVAETARVDILRNVEKELALLDTYLPKPLEENELIAIIDQVFSETGASSMKDMGKVMKEVLARVGVRADAKKVSELVRTKLSTT